VFDQANSVNRPLGKDLQGGASPVDSPKPPRIFTELELTATKQIQALLENREFTDFIAFHEGEKYLGLSPDQNQVLIASSSRPSLRAVALGVLLAEVQEFDEVWDSWVPISKFLGSEATELVAELIADFENPKLEIAEKSADGPRTPYLFERFSAD
jgi:hypothetical protein